jgi:hypothetical protein
MHNMQKFIFALVGLFEISQSRMSMSILLGPCLRLKTLSRPIRHTQPRQYLLKTRDHTIILVSFSMLLTPQTGKSISMCAIFNSQSLLSATMPLLNDFLFLDHVLVTCVDITVHQVEQRHRQGIAVVEILGLSTAILELSFALNDFHTEKHFCLDQIYDLGFEAVSLVLDCGQV